MINLYAQHDGSLSLEPPQDDEEHMWIVTGRAKKHIYFSEHELMKWMNGPWGPTTPVTITKYAITALEAKEFQ